MRFIAGLALLVAVSAAFAWAGDDAPAPPPTVPTVAQYEGKSAVEWTAELASEDVKLRQKAAYALFKMGTDAKTVALPLVKAIRDADPYVRTTSASAVAKLGADAVKPAAAELAAAMFDERPEVRREAASLVWRLGPLAADIVPELTKALASADEVVRAKAAWCLGNAGAAGKPALGALAKAASDPVEDVRKGAANAIAKIDPATAFASERTFVRLAALQVCSEWPRDKVRADPAIVAGVLKSIEDRDEEVRGWAVHTLDNFAASSGGEPPVEWIAVFLHVLETQRAAGPRAAAAAGLGRYKGHGAEVVPALLVAARSREPEVRTTAILALRWLGEEAKAAKPVVLEALRDEDAGIRAAAANALGAFGDSSDAVTDALAAALTDADRWVVRGAITSLGALGKGSERVSTHLTRYLLRPDASPYACAEVVRMLVFDGTVLEAKAQLTDAFEKDAKAPLSVAFALRALDAPSSEEAFARLTKALSDGTDPNTVLAYLRMLGPKAAGATSAVVPFLSNEDPIVRMTAAVALGDFGPGAKDALPALERAAKDADANVALGSKQAIESIRGGTLQSK